MILTLALDKGSIHIIYRKALCQRLSIWALAFGSFFLLTSCNSKKYLSEDQSFLFNNKISIKSKYKVSDAADLKENLATLYRQPATKTVAGIPRHVFYYQYQKSLEKNPGRKKWSEERLIKNRPVIHDSTKAELTTVDFEKYLTLRGYRYAQASYKAKTDNKETTVYYKVDPGPRTYVDSFIIAASDTALLRIIEADQKNTFFPPGSPLDIELYNKERARIVNLFQNEGYALFDETYISPLEVDTSSEHVKATMRIQNETDSTLHKKYYVGSVTVFPDYNFSDTSYLTDTIVHNVRYIIPGKQFTLKPEAIERNLFIHSGDLTRKNNFNQTKRNLGRIQLIKFVTPSVEYDSTSSNIPLANYTFYLSRHKKIPVSASVELTYSNIAGQKRTLLGTAVGASYKDLNIFKGAEVLSLNYETGVEFDFLAKQISKDRSIVNSLNITAGTSLSLPRFIDPLHQYHMIGYKKDEDPNELTQSKLRKWFLYDATSRLSLSYNLVDIQDLYSYNAVNIGLNYDIKPDAANTITIERAGFDLFTPDADPLYQMNVLDHSKFQQESFSKQLYTGLGLPFFFKRAFFDYNQGPQNKGSHLRILHNYEISGAEIFLINALTNAITDDTTGYYIGKADGLPGDTITFSHFVKGEADFRYFYNLNSKTQVALRFNAGLASPFGYTKQVPYPKQFWVGGAQSIRAWQVRELGPGGYEDTFYIKHKNEITAFYQTGDIKIDMTAEMRFPLFWYFDGAVFVDAANVWTIYEDDSRPGTQFKFNEFYRQFGIGYGYGIRMDLDYFIIRLDAGYKLYNPYPIEDPHTHTQSRLLKESLRDFPGGAQLQLAVGLNFN